MARLAPRLAAFKEVCAKTAAVGRAELVFSERVATLTLRNPTRKNALSPPMMADLHDAVVALRAWDEGAAVILRGEAPGGFCAGADLGAARDTLSSPEAGRLMSELMSTTLDEFRNLPMLTVCAVDGHAVGGGAELCTASDWRCFGADAKLRFVQAKMGVSPGWGGGSRLAAIVGRAEALRLLAHAPTLDAEDARALGLSDASAAPGETAAQGALRLLIEPALDVAASHDAIRACKRSVSAETIAAETDAFASVWGSSANREAVRASAPGAGRRP